MKKALFLTFDIIRDGENDKSLAIAYILSALKQDTFIKENLEISHISITVFLHKDTYILPHLSQRLDSIKLDEYSLIAISAYIWNEFVLNDCIELLRSKGFIGSIILGGYQITYMDKDKLPSIYPDAQVFIFGYGEESLKIFFTDAIKNKLTDNYPVFYNERVDFDLLPSPYLSGEIIIEKHSPMLRMETKRGCQFYCAFCAHKDLTHNKVYTHCIDKSFQELQLFYDNKVKKINIIDPIFNIGTTYLDITKEICKLGGNTLYSLQTRFESIDDIFCNLVSSKNFHLEFGLQSIHKNELEIIDRHSNMNKITATSQKMKDYGISYEVSIIYGLPEQTYDSFRQTIDFLHEQGCKNIKAFPLMIYRGTKLYTIKDQYNLQEEILGDFRLPYVTSSSSFTNDEWHKMDDLAKILMD